MGIKFVSGLLIGAAVGAAVVHFLNTREGKEMMDNLKEDAAKIEEEFSNLAEDLIQKGRSFVDDMDAGQSAI